MPDLTFSRAEDLAFALRLADAADEITMGRYQALDLLITTKPDLTPVTDADKATEEKIRGLIEATRPTDGLVGEEFGGVAATESKSAQGRYWVIDPIDGTKNFMRGVPTWATLIALIENDEVVVGVVSAPALARRWFAAAGSGAHVIFRDGEAKQISVSGISDLSNASLLYSDLVGWDKRLPNFMSLMQTAWRTRGVGDFWSHMLVAEGAAEIAAEPSLALWDMAALDIIVREAGGRFTSCDGLPGPHHGSGISTNARLHDQVIRRLNEK